LVEDLQQIAILSTLGGIDSRPWWLFNASSQGIFLDGCNVPSAILMAMPGTIYSPGDGHSFFEPSLEPAIGQRVLFADSKDRKLSGGGKC
jgi:hypothetical protein